MITRSQLPHPAFGGTVSALVYNAVILPGIPELRSRFEFAAGQSLRAWSILGAITAPGPTQNQLVLSDASAADGSQTPFAVLGEDLDTTLGSKVYSVYTAGKFNETALVYGPGHTANSCRVPLRLVGIALDVPYYSAP